MKFITLALAALLVAGCVSNPSTTQPATAPSLTTLTIQADASLDAAVNVITIGLQTGLISKSDFTTYILPAVTSTRTVLKTMEEDAQNGDSVDWNTADSVYVSAMTQLAPYIAKAQATTKP